MRLGHELQRPRPDWFHILLWLAASAGLFLAFNFSEILFLRPQSVHFWRQTDSLSFISGFVKNGGGIFSPSVLNLQCGNGQTAAEFPLVYWIIANTAFLKVHAETSLRTVYLLTHLIGLGFLYRTFLKQGMGWILAISATVLVGSSCVLNYYAANYVPDAFAFGLTLIGLYYGLEYLRSERLNDLIVATAVFTLAGLTKVQFLVYPIALVACHFLTTRPVGKNSLRPLAMMLPALVAFAWFSYVRAYNDQHCANCFLTTVRPIWNLDRQQVADVWDHVTRMWWTSYYYATTFHLLYVVAVFVIVLWRRVERRLLVTTLLAFLGCGTYFLLFYAQFAGHDYYAIAFVPMIALLLASFGSALKNEPMLNGPKATGAITLSIAIISILSVNYGSYRLAKRYVDGVAKVGMPADFHTLNLSEMGIADDALVISYPDLTCNGTLYFMDRRGFTVSVPRFSHELLLGYRDRGASHIVTEIDRLAEFDGLYLTEVGRHGPLAVLQFN